MKKKMRVIAFILASLLMVSLFAACGTGTATPSPAASSQAAATPVADKPAESSAAAESTPEALPEPVTLTFLIDNQAVLDGINAVAAEAEKRFNITLETELRPGGAEGDNVVKTRLATGDMSDICAYNSGSLFQALNPEQNFLDLTDEPFMENVIDSFKVTVSSNGRVFGIPSGATMGGGWFYNKKVYEDLGLAVPKTWDELMANCEAVKTAGKVPVLGSYKDSWTSQLIVLADNYNVMNALPTFADDYTANKAKIATTPVALKSFQKLQEVFDRGFMNKDLVSTTYDAALKMLAEGDGAHYPMLTFAIPNIAANFPDLINDIGFFAQPGDDAAKNGLTIWLPGGFYGNRNSKNTEAILKWFSLYASVEGMDIYMSAQKPDGPLPIKGTTLPDDVFPAVKDMLPYFQTDKTAPALEFLSPIKGPNLPQFCVEVGAGLKPAEIAAAEYDKDVEKQAKQLGLEGW